MPRPQKPTKNDPDHLGGDKWRVRVYAGIDPATGRRRRRSRSFTAPNITVARVDAEKVRTALRAEITEDAKHAGTVAELAKDWLELKRRQGLSPATIEGYETIVKAIVARFGRTQVALLKPRDIDRWHGELAAEMVKGRDGVLRPLRSANTVLHYHAVLRGMLRQAERWDQVPKVVTRQTSPPKPVHHEIRPPTTEVVQLMFARAETPASVLGDGQPVFGSDFARLVRLAAGTGMRRGELCGLRFTDVTGGTLSVRRSVLETAGGLVVKVPKGRRARTFVIGPDLTALVDLQRARLEENARFAHRHLVADPYVFADESTPDGSVPRAPTWVSHQWARLCAAMGVTYRFHDLRHWNATYMVGLGIDSATGAARLGHAQVSTFDNVYTHRDNARDRAAAELLTGALAPKTAEAPGLSRGQE